MELQLSIMLGDHITITLHITWHLLTCLVNNEWMKIEQL